MPDPARNWQPAAFVLLAATLAIAALSVRAAIALGTPGLLEWDETYSASSTATAAHGIGLYPYVLGYPPIHAMGGLGYVIYLYVPAYAVLGPHLFGLRLVSLLAAVAAVAGLVVLTRRMYGSAAGNLSLNRV